MGARHVQALEPLIGRTLVSEHCTCATSDYCQVHDQIESLKARLAAVEAECTDLIAGKEYQAMQRTLAEVNARLAEVTRERDEAVRELKALRGVIIDAMVNGPQPTDSATPRENDDAT